MLPEQPPNSVRMVGTRKDTFTLCNWSASSDSPKRPGNCMMVSVASEPQISDVLVMIVSVKGKRWRYGSQTP